MNTLNEYRHAMKLVKEVEKGPLSKFSAETRAFADMVRAVDNFHKAERERIMELEADIIALQHDLYIAEQEARSLREKYESNDND